MDERLLELSGLLEEWFVGDWAFKKELHPGFAYLDQIYLSMCKTMPTKEAGKHAVYTMMKGVIDGKTYQQIAEETIRDQEGPKGSASLESGKEGQSNP